MYERMSKMKEEPIISFDFDVLTLRGLTMIAKEKLARINELANKAKEEQLTKEEQREQEQLRKEYLEGVRQSFKNQLTSMKIIDPEGKDVTPKKIKEIRRKK